MKLRLIVAASLLCLPFMASAHGPTPQKANEVVEIKAPLDKVWDVLKKFEQISTWHPGVKESVGDGKKEAPRIRTITLQNGEQLVEEVDFYTENDHEFGYRLKTENVKALPVSSYSVKFQAVQGDSENSTKVSVKGRFYRGDTGNTPPDNLNDEAATKSMTEFFKSGLNGLKQKLEQ